MNLTQQLTQYCPWNEQEEADRRELLRRLESGEEPLHPEQRRRTPDRIGMGGQSGPAAGPHGLSQSL